MSETTAPETRGSGLSPEARDALFRECARVLAEVGPQQESLLLARLTLLLFEQVADPARCREAIRQARSGLDPA